jgi:hypothetical protein
MKKVMTSENGSSSSPIINDVDPTLRKFWGVDMDEFSLELCKTLRWAKCGRNGRWSATSRIRHCPICVIAPGSFKLECDELVQEFLRTFIRYDLDVYFGTDGDGIAFRMLLSAMDLAVDGYIRMEHDEPAGVRRAIATDQLATLWSEQLSRIRTSIEPSKKAKLFLGVG